MKLGLKLGLDVSISSGTVPGLLDEFSGATAAYSLRYLTNNYTGDVVLVRRSSDNAEEGFTPTEISDGTLETFCGVGDGFIKTWYDQSGNENNVTQTTNINQPKIVNAGNIIITNGLPTIQFSGSQNIIDNSISINSLSYSAFMVASCDISATSRTLLRCRLLGGYGAVEGVSFLEFSTSENNVNVFIDDGSGNALGVANASFANDGNFNLTTSILTSTTANTWRNSNNVGGSNSLEAGNTPLEEILLPFIDIGGGQVSRFWIGSVSEIILYDSNKSIDRTAIETTINSYYSIY